MGASEGESMSSLPGEWEGHLQRGLDHLESAHLLRHTRKSDEMSACFGSNDYLGLAQRRTAAATTSSFRCPERRGSILVSGYSAAHEDLEEKILELKSLAGCPGACAVLFPSGFAANLSVGMALCSVHAGQNPSQRIHVYSDELNHASIIDGIRFAKAMKGSRNNLFLHVYKHNDVKDLERQLQNSSGSDTGSLSVVFSESVFSMDGDICDLRGIAQLKQDHKFLLVLDEAHATLVMGDRGGGVAQALGLSHEVDLAVGTLSKAVGSFGGFAVARSGLLRSILLNKGGPVIYSTALPSALVREALTNIDIGMGEQGSAMREKLRKNVRFLTKALVERGFICGEGGGKEAQLMGPIIPVAMPSEQFALRTSSHLWEKHGIFVPAIRPPTVPTSRLRIAVLATHSLKDLLLLADALTETRSAVNEHARL